MPSTPLHRCAWIERSATPSFTRKSLPSDLPSGQQMYMMYDDESETPEQLRSCPCSLPCSLPGSFDKKRLKQATRSLLDACS